MGRACDTHGKVKNVYTILVGKPVVKRPLGRHRRTREDNIQGDLRMERLVAGCCEHGNEPSGSINSGEFLDWLSDYHLLKTDSVPLSELGMS